MTVNGQEGEFGAPSHLHGFVLNHMGGFAESQETVGVSPEMYAEFVLSCQLLMCWLCR